MLAPYILVPYLATNTTYAFPELLLPACHFFMAYPSFLRPAKMAVHFIVADKRPGTETAFLFIWHHAPAGQTPVQFW
jgi:hypothetical protein